MYKDIILKEKNEDGVVFDLHPQTAAEQVVLKNQETVENKLKQLSDKIIAKTYKTTIDIASKQPVTVAIPLEQELETMDYIVLSTARASESYGNWIGVTQSMLSDRSKVVVSLFNHGEGTATGTITIDYLLIKK